VSNVDTMPGSRISAGNSFSELIHAYAGFREAGYGVQFVSPDGGAVPLAYIDTSNREHKASIYDADFMWALANTRRPDEVDPGAYAALMYIGGSAAMYGVAENTGMQSLAVRIYEQQGGVVSAVCHGSAGLVKRKAGHRLSGCLRGHERGLLQDLPVLDRAAPAGKQRQVQPWRTRRFPCGGGWKACHWHELGVHAWGGSCGRAGTGSRQHPAQ